MPSFPRNSPSSQQWQLQPHTYRRQALSTMQALNNASKYLLQPNNTKDLESAIFALLQLATDAHSTISATPSPFSISPSLKNLWPLLDDLREHQQHGAYGICSFLSNQITKNKISKLGYEIQSQLQAYVDRVSVVDLVETLQDEESTDGGGDDDRKVEVLIVFDQRLRQGFSEYYQELVLRGTVLTVLESLLCDINLDIRVKDQAALAVLSLVKFNRNVFMRMVLVGRIIPALVETASFYSIRVLSSLIRCFKAPAAIKSELLARIINLVLMSSSSEDVSVSEAAMHCLYQIAFYGTREVIQEMLRLDLVKKLVELQRLKKSSRISKSLEEFPFEDCVAKFALQIQVGEGVEERKEKEGLKLEILRMVREACVSAEEEATIVLDILFLL